MGRTDLEAASVMARGVIIVLTLERDEARAERDALREQAEAAERERDMANLVAQGKARAADAHERRAEHLERLLRRLFRAYKLKTAVTFAERDDIEAAVEMS